MKKLFLFVLCLAAAFSANAQFVQNSYNPDTRGGETTVGKRGFFKIAYLGSALVSYKFSTQTSHGLERTSVDANMSGIIFTRSQCIANAPFYLEFGGGFMYNSCKNMFDTEELDVKTYSLYVPLNMSYRINESDNLSWSVFAGPYLEYNFAGSYAGVDIFEANVGARVQFGWQGGIDVSITNDWYISFSYFSEFTDLLDMSSTGYYAKTECPVYSSVSEVYSNK